MVNHKGMNNNQDVPSECHHASKCDSKTVCGGLASEEKVIFCPQTISANPPSSFPQVPQKEYLRSWDRSHWRTLFGLLRAITIKGRSLLYFQSDQILQFLICVLKNLMATSNAFTPIDWRQSPDKDSLSGCWPLRPAAKRMTFSLRYVPWARAPPHSQTCS